MALRLTDALMTLPGSIDAALQDQAREHFSQEELVGLTLDVMKWNYQKVSVALGTDREVTSGELTDLAFDPDGQAIYRSHREPPPALDRSGRGGPSR